MIKRMYHWCKDRAGQRTSWDGLILIGVSLVALLVQSLVMYAAVAGILWGIWTIIKDQAYD